MDDYVNAVLCPFESDIARGPCRFARRTAITKINGSFTLSSSLVQGHVLARVRPAYVLSTAANFIEMYTDGVSALNVTNLPVVGNLTLTGLAGVNMSTIAQFARIVGLEIRLKYIGAELTQAGELCVGMDATSLIVLASDCKTQVRDMMFSTRGPSDSTFRCIVPPLDEGDFIMTQPGAVPLGKTIDWRSIYIVGTGFPLGIPVYDVEWCYIIEFIVIPAGNDFIPRALSSLEDSHGAMSRIKHAILSDPNLPCGNSNYAHQVFTQRQATFQQLVGPVETVPMAVDTGRPQAPSRY